MFVSPFGKKLECRGNTRTRRFVGGFDHTVIKMWTVRMFGLTDWWKHFTEALSPRSDDWEDVLFVNFALSWAIPKFVFVKWFWIPYCLINKIHFTELFCCLFDFFCPDFSFLPFLTRHVSYLCTMKRDMPQNKVLSLNSDSEPKFQRSY